MAAILIGLDDTDNATSRGTGRLARMLSAECARHGLAPLGVTRHQFLLDDRIPYTSHNSGACVAVAGQDPHAADFAFDFVAQLAAPGSDPGVCVALSDGVSEEVTSFGYTATTDVVEMAEAIQLAKREGIDLRELGGTGLGVIGAIGAVGLRAGKNEGRFIDLPGIRDLPEWVTPEDFSRLEIALDYPADRCPRPDDRYNTLSWVRLALVAGRAVLKLKWSDEHHAWIPFDRAKSSRPPG